MKSSRASEVWESTNDTWTVVFITCPGLNDYLSIEDALSFAVYNEDSIVTKSLNFVPNDPIDPDGDVNYAFIRIE
ncbi:hypothetical protein [Sanyastnella coralliicola]|uniref:hypothetical protein n=1 Tax=Sanyastnella coralliicola TaxID=3069118 RepID=UPI0027BA6ACF|nr:hypothetical protein [Longitalea sp. SCSIO 12813]